MNHPQGQAMTPARKTDLPVHPSVHTRHGSKTNLENSITSQTPLGWIRKPEILMIKNKFERLQNDGVHGSDPIIRASHDKGHGSRLTLLLSLTITSRMTTMANTAAGRF